MDRKKLKTLAKKRLKDRVILCFALILLVGVVTGAISMFPVVGGLAMLLISGSITISFAYIFYQMVDKNRKPEIEDLLVGFRDDNFLRGLVGYLLYAIFTFLWSLLLIIPGIIKSISYSQMFYIMADDPDIDATDAMKKSMKLMKGHKMDYFILQLSFIPWYLLCGITFGIAYIWVGPYVSATNAAFYKEISSVKSQVTRAVEDLAEEAKEVKKKVTKKAKAVKKALEK
ncbi:DUF975 family protein [Candidatus Saccharibacteria bacterium]|nr:DUF975 family protein [Candidatus Saccharibacteria bacterium]